MLSLTYGVMPTRRQYDEAWDETARERGDGPVSRTFSFGNDKRVGNCVMTPDELWVALRKAHEDFEIGSDAAGDWCSQVLGCLGIEWV